MEILKDDHKALLTRCTEVTYEVPKHVIDSMFTTMYEADGIGLAANQVGIMSRFFIMDISKKGMHKHVFINPVIVEKSRNVVKFEEGCLSYNNVRVRKLRHSKITVEYKDYLGRTKRKIFKDIEAIVIQHEIDHLNGVSFVEESN
jgi:peptide deformylase